MPRATAKPGSSSASSTGERPDTTAGSVSISSEDAPDGASGRSKVLAGGNGAQQVHCGKAGAGGASDSSGASGAKPAPLFRAEAEDLSGDGMVDLGAFRRAGERAADQRMPRSSGGGGRLAMKAANDQPVLGPRHADIEQAAVFVGAGADAGLDLAREAGRRLARRAAE